MTIAHPHIINMNINDIYAAQQAYFDSGATLPYAFRKTQLKRLRQAIKKHENAILEALHADMGKHALEAYGSEVGFLYTEIDHILTSLKRWMQPEEVTSPLEHYPSHSKIIRSPLGLTLIIAPWNYPFQLLVGPLAGAIAGGNCAVLKPSELAPHTATVIERLIADTFPPQYIALIQGEGSEVIPALMEHRFDHVFFTGSTAVGKKVMEMAAQHLTPVTLELGGKSPCVVDDRVNIKVAARRIVWGKFWNAGQTCVAPDYVLVHSRVKAALIAAMEEAIVDQYGQDPAASPDYGRIINARRFDTLTAYLQQGRIIHGGRADREKLYIAPSLIEEVEWSSPIMQEEIFGPILPVLAFDDLKEAMQLIRRHPYPLSLYVFTKRASTRKLLEEQVRFGGGCINNTLVHLTNPELPFGGVGASGMGHYHGRYSFDTFTHPKGIMRTATWLDVPMKYPPFKNKLKYVKLLIK
ncbi:aldehyde dehydrogenase [Chitinophaga agrisoli]|nr:aldehyde dehydrogenase [Chitinophaga agrisoli]